MSFGLRLRHLSFFFGAIFFGAIFFCASVFGAVLHE